MAPSRDIEEASDDVVTVDDEPTRRPCCTRKKKIAIAVFNVTLVAVILGVFLSKSKTSLRSFNPLKGDTSPYGTSPSASSSTSEEVSSVEESSSSTSSNNNSDASTSSVAKEEVTDFDSITVYEGELPAFVSSRISQLARETCDANEVLTNIDLVTDGYAAETSWEINRADGTQLAFGPPTGQTYSRMTSYKGELCLPVGRNILVIKDKAGDGLCCKYGNGKMTVSANGETLVETGDEDFKSQEYPFDVFNTGSTGTTDSGTSSTEAANATDHSGTTVAMTSSAATTAAPKGDASSTGMATTTGIVATDGGASSTGMATTAANTTSSTAMASTTAGMGSTDAGMGNSTGTASTAASTGSSTGMASTVANTGSSTGMASSSTGMSSTVANTGSSTGMASGSTTTATVAIATSTSVGVDPSAIMGSTPSAADGEHCVTIEVMADAHSKTETAYAFSSKPTSGNPVVYLAKGVGELENDQLYKDTVCVPAGTYELYVEDSYRGLCCSAGQGYYSVQIGGEEILFGGNYNNFPEDKVTHEIVVGDGPDMSERDQEWLDAHNSRRETFHKTEGTEYVPLVWSTALAEDAANWLEEILVDCKTHRQSGLNEGENLSFRKVGTPRDTEGPEFILKRWVDFKMGKDYPTNESLTQAMWRATRYVGCSDKSKTYDDGSICYASICRYVRAGNCIMFKYDDWKEPTLADHTICGPICPEDGCH